MKIRLMVLSTAVLLLASCSSVASDDLTPPYSGAAEEIKQEDSRESGPALALSDLNGSENEEMVIGSEDADNAGIIFMREEEKLARDVYLQLADIWGMNIFSNITSSEDTHMDAVLTLIDSRGLADPVLGNAVGEFDNQDLQTLYDELVARGSVSLSEALLVGAAIEEIDILDLQELLAKTTDEDIVKVYQNLLQGSINHLQSFVRTFERQTGDEYQPQFLTQEAFRDLISLSFSRDHGRGQGQSSQQGGRGQAQ